MTLGCVPSITATQEFVVPRSIPITLLICSTFSCSIARRGGRPVSQLRSTTSVNAQRNYVTHGFRLYKNGLRGLQASGHSQFLQFNRIPCGKIVGMTVSAGYRTGYNLFLRDLFHEPVCRWKLQGRRSMEPETLHGFAGTERWRHLFILDASPGAFRRLLIAPRSKFSIRSLDIHAPLSAASLRRNKRSPVSKNWRNGSGLRRPYGATIRSCS